MVSLIGGAAVKKILSLIMVTFICISAVFPAYADIQTIPTERQKPLLVDDADILSDSEESELLEKLTNISQDIDCEIAIVTVNSLEGKTAEAFADDYYDYNGYGAGAGDDGAILVLAMDNRKYAVSTYGYAHKALTDAGLKNIRDNFLPEFKKGDYYEGFNIFADMSSEYIKSARNGHIMDVNDFKVKKPFPLVSNIFISLGIGFVIGLAATSAMASQLKSVAMQKSAVNYVKRGSLNVTNSSELFLYANVNKEYIEPSSSSGGSSGGSSSHTSSSGRSHGGISGSF